MKLATTVAALKRGETVTLKSPTHHLSPILAHGQDVTIAPIADMMALKEGDIVLTNICGNKCLRIVRSLRMSGASVSGMNKGQTRYVTFGGIYGIVKQGDQ